MGRAAAPLYTFTPVGEGIRDAQGAPRASFRRIHAVPFLPESSTSTSTVSSASLRKFQHFIHAHPVDFAIGDVVYLRTSSGRPDVAVITDLVVWDDEEVAGSTRNATFVSARVFLRGGDLAASTSRAMGNLIDEVRMQMRGRYGSGAHMRQCSEKDRKGLFTNLQSRNAHCLTSHLYATQIHSSTSCFILRLHRRLQERWDDQGRNADEDRILLKRMWRKQTRHLV